MMSDGRLLTLGLSASHDNSESVQVSNPGPAYCLSPGPEMKVNVVVNGNENVVYSIVKPVNRWSNTISFSTPLGLKIGDRINFVSQKTYSDIKNATVCALIELDL